MKHCRPFSSLYALKYLLLLSSFLITSLAAADLLPTRIIAGQQQASLAPIVKEAAPAVVNIATYVQQRQYNPLFQSPFFRRFFDLPEQIEAQREMQSAGSGVIVDAEQGYVLTNHHVIANSDDLEVTLNDGRKLAATLIGSDEKVDIALLQIPAEKLTALPMAMSQDIEVGDFVLAIGNPFGLSQTVTSGIVSALGRNGLGIQGYEDFIQTDASINPGNSGGALIDLNGRLVGINSAIIAPAGGNVGIGFAIPTDVTLAIMRQLINHGSVRRGGIGARFQDLTPELAEAFDLDTFQGAVVAKVYENSAADEAGLKPGDIVTHANQRQIKRASDITNRIGLSPLGESLTLQIIRNKMTLEIETDIRPIPIPSAQGGDLSRYLEGSTLNDLIPQDQEDSVGVIITELNRRSAAARLGFETGDIIFGVNRQRIRSINALRQYLHQRNVQAFRIRRGYDELIVYTH